MYRWLPLYGNLYRKNTEYLQVNVLGGQKENVDLCRKYSATGVVHCGLQIQNF